MIDVNLLFAYTLLGGHGWSYDEAGKRFVAPNGEAVPKSDFERIRTDKDFALAAMARGGTPFLKEQ